MAKAATPIPAGFHTLTLHLSVKGAAQYIDFLKRAFGGVELMRAPGPDGRLMHAEVQLGDSILMFSDLFPEFGQPAIPDGPRPLTLQLYVPNCDAVFQQAIAAGCEVTMPMGDQFWGDRYGQLKDPFGFNWAVATHQEDPTPAEMEERRKAAFGGGQ